MAAIHPFAALRPRPEYAREVAALPYDVLSTDEARAMAADNPYSFLHVDKAEIDLPRETPPHDPSVYAKARENLDKLTHDGVLIQDDQPCLYIYRLTAHNGRSQTGLAACVDARAYDQGQIKKHELTRKDKEQDRVAHIQACSAHTGPIFMTYRARPETRARMRTQTEAHAPVYDFTAPDGVRHTVWVVNDPNAIQSLTDAFRDIPNLYIADGHHRSAAAARIAAEAQAGDAAEISRFLSVIFPHDELTILDYNRLVRDLNGMDETAFLTALADTFTVETATSPVKPSKWNEFGLYTHGQWRRLTYKAPTPADTVDKLPVSILQNALLAPVLAIGDPQTDTRIDFVGGARGTDGLSKRVDNGEMAAAFTVYPTTLQELMSVSDSGRIMPPKSTWFEPKLRSGLLIHRF